MFVTQRVLQGFQSGVGVCDVSKRWLRQKNVMTWGLRINWNGLGLRRDWDCCSIRIRIVWSEGSSATATRSYQTLPFIANLMSKASAAVWGHNSYHPSFPPRSTRCSRINITMAGLWVIWNGPDRWDITHAIGGCEQQEYIRMSLIKFKLDWWLALYYISR